MFSQDDFMLEEQEENVSDYEGTIILDEDYDENFEPT
jgi:hypothetical protein